MHFLTLQAWKRANIMPNFKNFTVLQPWYPMSVQSVKKRNGCTLATAHKKIQHTLAGAEKSVKYRVWPGRNKAYFYNTICRETKNSPAKVFTKSAGLPAKRRPLRFFTPRPNTARKFWSCRSDKGYGKDKRGGMLLCEQVQRFYTYPLLITIDNS